MQQTVVLPPDVVQLATELGIGDRIHTIMDVTQEMYPGPISVEAGRDPEWPDDRWISFRVEDGREVQASIDWQLEWNRRIVDLISDCPLGVALSVSPR